MPGMANKAKTQPVPTPAIRTAISLFLKDDGKAPNRITKAKRDAVADVLRTSRVRRDALVDYVMSGDYFTDDAIPPSVIDNPHRRMAEHPDAGWIIPDDCLGRAPKDGVRDWDSTAQSVLLWIKRVLVDTGILRVSQVSVLVVTIED